MNVLQRFIPTGFGSEEEKIKALPPFQAVLDEKRKIREKIEAAGIPYTSINANCFAAYFINYLLRPHQKLKDIVVYGTGEAKGNLIHFSHLILDLTNNFIFIQFSFNI